MWQFEIMISISEPETGLINLPAVKNKRRMISKADVDGIAKLVAECKLTETEACLNLGINVKQWQNWKNRAGRTVYFGDLITRIRSASITNIISGIKEVSQGIGVKQRDWRAGAWIVERLAPDRFAQAKQAESTPQTVVNISVMHDTLRRIYSDSPQSSGIIPPHGLIVETMSPCQPEIKDATISNAEDCSVSYIKAKTVIPVRR